MASELEVVFELGLGLGSVLEGFGLSSAALSAGDASQHAMHKLSSVWVRLNGVSLRGRTYGYGRRAYFGSPHKCVTVALADRRGERLTEKSVRSRSTCYDIQIRHTEAPGLRNQAQTLTNRHTQQCYNVHCRRHATCREDLQSTRS